MPLIKAAIAHRGMALLDVVSPCVTFNDHDGSTKSYSWVKEHDEEIHDVSFIPYFEEIAIDYEPGTTVSVEMHDGSHLLLKKLGEDYDPTDRIAAIQMVEESRGRGQLVTGLLYIDESMPDFATTEHLPAERALRDLGEQDLRMSRADFDTFLEEFA